MDNIECRECKRLHGAEYVPRPGAFYYDESYDLICKDCGLVVTDSKSYLVQENTPEGDHYAVTHTIYQTRYHFNQILYLTFCYQRPPPQALIDAIVDQDLMHKNGDYSKKDIRKILDGMDPIEDYYKTHPNGDPVMIYPKHFKKKWVYIRKIITGVEPRPMSTDLIETLMNMFIHVSPHWVYVRQLHGKHRKIWIRLGHLIHYYLELTERWHPEWDEYFPYIKDQKKRNNYMIVCHALLRKAGVIFSNE